MKKRRNETRRARIYAQLAAVLPDRGEIYCNHELICDNSYHVAGKSDTSDTLARVIREKMGLR